LHALLYLLVAGIGWGLLPRGLTAAGVDLIESDEGPMVMAVNSSPGLEGIQKTSGVDVADAFIERAVTFQPDPETGEK
jgi:glutathione synthase/RimK-type ligase-like ATP-grasp enzyme